MSKVCCRCKKEKAIEEFWRKKRSKDGRDTRCGDCMKLYYRDLYHGSEKRRRDIRRNDDANIGRLLALRKEIYSSTSCTDCGNQDHRVFEFDHVRGRKEFDISTAIHQGHSRKRLLKEIEKCDLVCANCHRIRTYERRARSKV